MKFYICFSLHCSPNQAQDDAETFENNSELNIDTVIVNNPFSMVFFLISVSSQTFGLREIRHHTSYGGTNIDFITPS